MKLKHGSSLIALDPKGNDYIGKNLNNSSNLAKVVHVMACVDQQWTISAISDWQTATCCT